MGVMLLWFQGNDVAELEKEKQKRLEKIDQLNAEVEILDEKIAELKG